LEKPTKNIIQRIYRNRLQLGQCKTRTNRGGDKMTDKLPDWNKSKNWTDEDGINWSTFNGTEKFIDINYIDIPESLLDQIRREAVNEFVKELNTAYSIKWLPIQVKRVLHSKGLLEKYTGDIPEEKKE